MVNLGIIGTLFPKNIGKGLGNFATGITSVGDAFKKVNSAKFAKGLAITGKTFKGLSKSFMSIVSLGFDFLGILTQLGMAMGIMQPIMQMITGVLGIMGAGAYGEEGGMIDALQKLSDFLFDSDMIIFWKELGAIIGSFFSTMIDGAIDLLTDPAVQKLIKNAVEAIIAIVIHLGKMLGGFIDLIAQGDISLLGKLLWGLAIMIAFFKGMGSAPGIFGVVLGIAMATMVGIALAPLLTLASGGIVTKPTIALIGESGPEAVIPLGTERGPSMIGDNEKVIWAIEDLGNKMDKTNRLLSSQGRLR